MVKRRILSGIEKHPPQQDEVHLVDDNGDDGSSENMFSKALLSLSLKERNQIEEEIHGVSCMAITETPELIEKALREFQYELEFVIADAQKIAYNKAKDKNICSNSNTSNSNSYLLCNENKLRFLRCEFFNPVQAVSRYVKYLDLLLYIYGDYNALRRPIQLLQDFIQ